MSMEEMKIQEELEMEIEKILEEEIKEGIYHFALKLHKLYQHKKEKALKQNSSLNQLNERGNFTRKNLISEVNINIRMEGETTIHIREIKKEEKCARGNFAPIIVIPRNQKHAQNVRGKTTHPRTIKFDWTQTLRSSHVVNINPKSRDKSRDKVDAGIKRSGLLEVEWKY